MSWTDERVEVLRKLWLEGLSASQIASALGDDITRNAVIGKVHRMGMSNRVLNGQTPVQRLRSKPPAPVEQACAATMPVTSTLVHGNTVIMVTEELAVEQPLTRPKADVVVQMICQPVTLMELRESSCRWPIGDPALQEFRFCGSKSLTGAPYCEGHRRLAYQPVNERRRDRAPERRAV